MLIEKNLRQPTLSKLGNRAIKKGLETRGLSLLALAAMLQRTIPAGFIAPCLPTKTDELPSGSHWLTRDQADGCRVVARKKGAQVKLYSRPRVMISPIAFR
jgi:ATP-dependent DNA ligase